MDKHRLFLLLRGFALAWALSWGSSLCLAAGISEETSQWMGAVWGIVSLIFTAALAKGGPVLLLIPGSLAALAAGDFLLPLGLPGCLVALGTCRTVLRGKGLLFTITVALAPLGLCLGRSGTLPPRGGLFLLLLGSGVLILTAHTRFQHPRQGNRLAAAAAPLLAAGLAIVLFLNPPESYVNHSATVRDLLAQSLPAVGGTGENALAPITVAPAQVFLRERPRVPSRQTVMTVTAQESGRLYLREQSYDCYDGSTWSINSGDTEGLKAVPAGNREVTIRTRGQRQHLFVGYYPREDVTLTDGAVPNSSGATEYTLLCSTLVHSPVSEELPVPHHLSRYLALPETTRLGAESLVPQEGSAWEKAQFIRQFLRRGTYTLNPEQLPEEEDFVLSFLEGNMEGTCTHFAAAAAVLLRAAGVPARLVGGYLVDGEEGKEVTVTEQDAHAWAEFYEPVLDTWLILDATPPQSPPPEPVPDPGGEVMEEEKPKILLPLLLLGITAAELQLWARRLLRWLYHRRLSPNCRALALWQEAQTFSRLLNQPVSGELAALSQKACFSPHQLTQGELSVFEDNLQQLRRRWKQKFFLFRLVQRWVYGVY